MGVEMVLIFISAILLICGLVLLFSPGGLGSRKAGMYLLMIGLLGIFISVVAYPRDRNYYAPVEYSNQSNNLR